MFGPPLLPPYAIFPQHYYSFVTRLVILTCPLLPSLQVERFLFRPGLQERARYYAVVFLNQMVLSHKASEGGAALAKKLVELYFTMFRMVIEGHFGRAGEARK